MRVFVTGASGFIGSHVVRELVRSGSSVTVLVRPGADRRRIQDLIGSLDVIEGSLERIYEHRDRLRGVKPDVCVHLAWYAEPGKYVHSRENLASLKGSLELLRVLEDSECRRLVGGGTSFEYDPAAGRVTEESRIRPTGIYGVCKHSFFRMAEELAGREGWSFVWGRIFNVYGPWEDERRLVPAVIRRLLAAEPCPLTSGVHVRDYLHVSDVARAFCALATNDLTGAVNIGSCRPVSVGAVAREIGALLGRPELLRFGELPDRPDDPPALYPEFAREIPGWRPTYSLNEGLAETIAWWRDAVGGAA